MLDLAKESLTPLQIPRLGLSLLGGLARRRGEGEPALVLPGFAADDRSTIPLRAFLRRVGFDARGWGLGTNRGDVPSLVPQVLDATRELSEEAAHPVALVGWSLGGVLAREVAREAPGSVSTVVTFGTPVIGGPRYTRVSDNYQEAELGRIDAAVAERNRVPIEVPVTAIFSRLDGVVAWQACVDDHNPGTENIKVGSTHFGMGIDPDVWRIVSERLAAAALQPRAS